MELQAATVAAVDRYWAAFFACPTSHLDAAQTYVVPHAQLGDYHGLFFFRRNRTLIISAPSTIARTHHAAFAHLTAADFADVQRLTARSPLMIERVVGPAWIGYADAATLRPAPRSAARLLTPADEPTFAALRAACSAEAWEHGGSTWDDQPLAGSFRDTQLVALAGYERWGAAIAHLAIVTHPTYHGRGYGSAAVSLMAETVLQAGLIPQYRTLCRNAPSMAIAARLGFVGYAESIALRLA